TDEALSASLLSVSLFRAIGHVLTDAAAIDDARRVLSLGCEKHPGDPSLLFDLRLNTIHKAKERPGKPVSDAVLMAALDRETTFDAELAKDVLSRHSEGSQIAELAARDRVPELEANERVLAGFATEPSSDGWPDLRRLTSPRGSSIELQIRAGWFFSQSDVRVRVRELSERDSWPELTEGSTPLIARARVLANIYAKRHEAPPY